MALAAPLGKIILVSGPSGSGKGTLVASVRTQIPDIALPVSCTTRAMRPGEVEGREYHFLSVEEFKKRIEEGEFLEWALYGGNYYGTPRAAVAAALAQGKTVLLEIEAQGARQVRSALPSGQVISVFIDAGSWEELVPRIRGRAPISDEELVKRHTRYDDERAYMKEATYVIKNEDGHLEEAKEALLKLILSIRSGAR